ncbi:uncharacterized protein A1O5_07647 [Cladophialophora psammophila CBS 110553]|uniref:SMODS and SLOG-associating 2TM effector domain-containing protein n=1 Tax=Cladophialophora psammophila CBS 110553 TaxID=1182543 RepID=W9WY70_9EURO|nr:uncharacterized protein A1O5_07647 [Cladophialophora psammophila CBS 110553]EXJ69611.1 hypothetical protein A1O5_07647 [Cladophialophora psammophila CBS 110553]
MEDLKGHGNTEDDALPGLPTGLENSNEQCCLCGEVVWESHSLTRLSAVVKLSHEEAANSVGTTSPPCILGMRLLSSLIDTDGDDEAGWEEKMVWFASVTKGKYADQDLWPRIQQAYKEENRYYHFVATLSYGLLWLQIAIGATVTAIGSDNNRRARLAVTILGAINTFIAGVLTFLKSRDQPNRALQFRNGLRDVCNELWRADAALRDPPSNHDDHHSVFNTLWDKYQDVLREADVNYPDLWVRIESALGVRKSQQKNQQRRTPTPPPAGARPAGSAAHTPAGSPALFSAGSPSRTPAGSPSRTPAGSPTAISAGSPAGPSAVALAAGALAGAPERSPERSLAVP